METNFEPTENSKNNYLELLPLISVLILVIAIIKQVVFYRYFKVPIKYFLNISEIGLLISDDLLTIVPFIIIYFFVNELFYSWKLDLHSTTKLYSNSVQSTFGIKGKLFLIFFSFAIFISTIFLIRFLDSYLLNLILIPVLIFSFLVILIIVTPAFVLRLIPTQKTFNLHLFFLILFTSILANTSIEIKNIVYENKYEGTAIHTSDTTYISDSASTFIGKTSDFIFMYDKHNKYTNVIPVNSITKMILKSK